MKQPKELLAEFLATDGIAGLITITRVRGSAPREAGAFMVVRADGRFSGTIGGGALEWQALGEIQRLLARHPAGHSSEKRFALGPALGQCCGGDVTLRFEVLDRESLACGDIGDKVPAKDRPSPLLLFGAGHVGRALVLVLAALPFAIRWIDPRRDAFPAASPANVTAICPDDPLAPFANVEPGTFVLAMTHSHALDLAICDAALRSPDVAFCGVIGSETKRARFLSQLRGLGHDEAACARLVCPIGIRDIASKEPAAIAAGVVVQLLLARQTMSQHSREGRDHTREAHRPAPPSGQARDAR